MLDRGTLHTLSSLSTLRAGLSLPTLSVRTGIASPSCGWPGDRETLRSHRLTRGRRAQMQVLLEPCRDRRGWSQGDVQPLDTSVVAHVFQARRLPLTPALCFPFRLASAQRIITKPPPTSWTDGGSGVGADGPRTLTGIADEYR